MSAVTNFHRQMTVDEYRLNREIIRATYGDTAAERTGSFEQSLVGLFLQSGWTQEQLAAEENKSQQWVEKNLRFGRFLKFTTAVVIPKSFSEGRFRDFWKLTHPKELNERIRFREVARLMEEAETILVRSPGKKPAIAEAVKQTSADGTWHRLATILSKVQAVIPEATEDDVRGALRNMVFFGSYHTFGEKKKGADIYRIVLGGKTKIDVVALRTELRPLLDGLKAEGRKNMATMSPPTVARLTFQLERLIDKLAHIAPED